MGDHLASEPCAPASPVGAPEWLREAGRFHYRCADGGYLASSSRLIRHCLWHGEDCIDWYVQVPVDQVPASTKENEDG